MQALRNSTLLFQQLRIQADLASTPRLIKAISKRKWGGKYLNYQGKWLPWNFDPSCLGRTSFYLSATVSFFIFIHHPSFYFELWTGQLTRSTCIDWCTNESWEQNGHDRIVIKIDVANNLAHQRNKTRWQSVGRLVSRSLSFLLLSEAQHRQLNMYATGRLRATSNILECCKEWFI